MDTTASALEPYATCRTISNVPAEAVRHVWEAKDGTSVLLRAIKPDDFEIERDFVNGLSRSTGYKRLMSGRRPTSDEMHRWTHIDPQREGAVIAVVLIDGRERQVGVARYAMEPGKHDVAECAIVISDAWHGRGLGSQLLSSLIKLARQSGLKRLYGTTLAENGAMVRLAQRLGFRVSYDPHSTFLWALSLELTSQE
ncbi:N-acetyltransferase family protein [Paraburkholderia terrae]